MAQPTGVLVDPVLTNISVAYIQRADHFKAGVIFPVVPVERQSGKYPTYTKADWFRDEATRRAPATESAGSGYGLSTAAYACDVFAIHKDVADQDRANAIPPLNPDRDATEFVTQRMLLRREIQWAADYFGASIWGTDKTLAGADQWSDVNSDPIKDVADGRATILKNTGFVPNKLIAGYEVFEALKRHPDIVDRMKYTSAEAITEAILARLLGVDEFLVLMAIKNTAVEGATASYSFVHGKHALLVHSAPSPSLLTPSAGYTFVWQGVSQGLGQDVGISSFRMEALRADRIEAEFAFDMGVVASDLGYFIQNASA